MSEKVIRERYDEMAQRYDRRWSTYIAKTLSFLDGWAAISPEAVVLDIGCGTGEFEKLILSKHPKQQITGYFTEAVGDRPAKMPSVPERCLSCC